jgi:hypothetical protein
MTSKVRYLTKSRFKEAWDCPTKLYFTGKKDYGNRNLDDAFLKALAEGGFQVGALAQAYYPGGVLIETLVAEDAIRRTNELMKQESITLFEPAISHGSLLARVDILVKVGKKVQLIEVKSKSYNPTKGEGFFRKRQPSDSAGPRLSTAWEPYFVDVAFQTLIFQRAYPDLEVTPYLMLVDTSKTATVEGLNQRFLLKKDKDGRTHVDWPEGCSKQNLGGEILYKHQASKEVQSLFDLNEASMPSFAERVDQCAVAYRNDKKIPPQVGLVCKACAYRVPIGLQTGGLKNGFAECWRETWKLSLKQLAQPMVFDLWNFRKGEECLAQDKVFISDLEEEDIGPEPFSDEKLTVKQRQWLQVERVKTPAEGPFINLPGLDKTLSELRYPFHMIDFETTRAAIPFHAGMHPYQTIAFQFSHHVLHKDGRIEHRSEFIERRPGKFPNFDFVRALKKSLEGDDGSIFRYAAHENTTLCEILAQLEECPGLPDDPLKDKSQLISWIQSITKKKSGSRVVWEGERNMVDLLELVKNFFYHPLTAGSNSIKQVLPAVMKASKFIQRKYADPIYGGKGPKAIQSKNFRNWPWIREDDPEDPYKLLPPIFDPTTDQLLEEALWLGPDHINEGGTAMTAYNMMQFTEMSDAERNRICAALLKYCELDTFAMVLVVEYWRSLLGAPRPSRQSTPKSKRRVNA